MSAQESMCMWVPEAFRTFNAWYMYLFTKQCRKMIIYHTGVHAGNWYGDQIQVNRLVILSSKGYIETGYFYQICGEKDRNDL